MNVRNENLKLSALALAVAGAFAATAAYASDEEAAALKTPSNFVEVGAENTGTSSAKFGEYNGLNKKGANVVGNFSVRGGDAYSNNENGGINRWSVTGTDLGTTSRNLTGTVSNQGEWNVGVGFDQLRHNLSDTYQTPYQGTMGGNSFVLPPSFGLVTTTGAGAPGTNALTPAQLGAFRPMDISTTRTNTSFNAGLNFNTRWSLNFDFNHLDQTGAKLMGFGSAGVGGANGEVVSILPMPTNYKTDNINLAVKWVGDNAHLTASYFGSFFRDGYDKMTFTTFSGASNTDIAPTAPNNTFHQLNLAGGYSISPATKLAANLSYGRNTQDVAFVAPETGLMVTAAPQSSAHGLVVTTHADAKLTNQTTKNLVLSAGFKYDQRDNQTPSSIYNFNAISGGNTANYPNTPLSNDKIQYELAGDYKIKQDHHVRLEYVHEDIKRWCNQYAVNAAYPLGTNCVVAKASQEDKLGATYRLKASDAIGFKIGYSVSNRKADLDPTAIAAFISTNGGAAGQNAGDFRGFSPYFDASRLEQAIKASTTWQAGEQLSFGVGGKYTYDGYRTTYGVQNGRSWSLNLDTTYSYSENGSIYSYLTKQQRQRDLTDDQRSTASAASATAISVPANGTWTNKLKDSDVTVGLGIKQGGLMAGKFELAGDLVYSKGDSDYSTQLNYVGATTGGATCSNAAILSCGALPTVRSETSQFKLTGTYQIEKSSKVVARYMFQHLNASDYYYNGYQYGTTPSGLLPTNQQAGSYNVNLIAVTYIHNF